MTSSSKNYYNPFGAVLLALIIFFLPVTFLYIILGISESLLDRDLLNQNPVNININGLETTLYPIKDNLLYLLSIPIQIWLMILFLKRKSISLTQSLGLYKFDKKAFISSFVLWLVVFALSYLYGYLLDIEIPEDFVNLTKAAPPILIAIVFIIGAPIVEELLFRGFLFSNLKHSALGINGSIILTTILWTSIHLQYDFSLLISLFFLGLLLGYIRYKYNSVYLAIVIHAIHNLLATINILFFI